MIPIVSFVKDSWLKNKGTSIFIIIDIYIEKWMASGQHVFHKEN